VSGQKRISIPLHKINDDARIIREIERACVEADLRISMKGTLRTIPGSVHWHFKSGNLPGVLEVTYSPSERRAWFSVHQNRNAPWIPAMILRVRRSLFAAD
jgi:hypothetical protein